MARWASSLRQQLTADFGLRGTASLTISIASEGGGYIVVNGSAVSPLPWSGIYFLDTNQQLIAVPGPGYVFASWADGSDVATTY
jgi:hypothetical protein